MIDRILSKVIILINIKLRRLNKAWFNWEKQKLKSEICKLVLLYKTLLKKRKLRTQWVQIYLVKKEDFYKEQETI